MALKPNDTKPNSGMANLDLLRCVAVISVVSAHLLVALRMEWFGKIHAVEMAPLGVYMFFVHTSLVLMWSLERRPNTLDFYVRRAFRLYPLAILAVLLVAALHLPVSQLMDGKFTGAAVTVYNVIFNCLLVNGLVGHGVLLLGTLWTLSPEMFMYILLPCLFFFARSVRKLWPLLLIWVLVVLLDRRSFQRVDVSSFGVLVPHFLAGIIAYVGFIKRQRTLPGWLFAPFFFCLAAFYLTTTMSGQVKGWLVSLAMGLLLPRFSQIRSETASRIFHEVAKYSYGIYIFHLITIYFGIEVLKAHSRAVQLTGVFAPLVVAVVLAYHLVEKPMIDLGARVAAKLAHERTLPSKQTLETLEPAP